MYPLTILDWANIINAINGTNGEPFTLTQLRNRLPSTIRTSIQHLLGISVGLLEKRLLVGRIDLRGTLCLPAPLLPRREDTVALPVFPDAVIHRFGSWSQLARIAVLTLSASNLPVTDSNLYNALSVPARRQIGTQATPFVTFLDLAGLLDPDRHLVGISIPDLIETIRLYFLNVLNQQ